MRVREIQSKEDAPYGAVKGGTQGGTSVPSRSHTQPGPNFVNNGGPVCTESPTSSAREVVHTTTTTATTSYNTA